MKKQLAMLVLLQSFCGVMQANFISKLLGLHKTRKKTPSSIIGDKAVTVSNYCGEEDFRVYLNDKGDFMILPHSNSIRIPLPSIVRLSIAENKEDAKKFGVNWSPEGKIYVTRTEIGALHIIGESSILG